MRINFSYTDPDATREGITRLGLLLREEVFKDAKKKYLYD
jgi:DNA-binding transcriptional MocR family regulator